MKGRERRILVKKLVQAILSGEVTKEDAAEALEVTRTVEIRKSATIETRNHKRILLDRSSMRGLE